MDNKITNCGPADYVVGTSDTYPELRTKDVTFTPGLASMKDYELIYSYRCPSGTTGTFKPERETGLRLDTKSTDVGRIVDFNTEPLKSACKTTMPNQPPGTSGSTQTTTGNPTQPGMPAR